MPKATVIISTRHILEMDEVEYRYLRALLQNACTPDETEDMEKIRRALFMALKDPRRINEN